MAIPLDGRAEAPELPVSTLPIDAPAADLEAGRQRRPLESGGAPADLSFWLMVIPAIALAALPMIAVIDLWSKRRFESTEAWIDWTIALVAGGVLGRVPCVIVVVRASRRVPVQAT